MGNTTIISTWLDEPQWTDGWPIALGFHPVPRPSLWLIDPVLADTVLTNRYDDTLSNDERARAERFHQPAHQTRYKTAHTLLRVLLADATYTRAADLHFNGGHHNKPNLRNDLDRSITFNLSYTENKSLIGIADGTAIGVDIEWLQRPIVIDDMLPSCFSGNEIRYITSKKEGMHSRFFTLWTRKEAILKLTGEGIGEHLPLFEVLDGTCVTKKEIIGGHPPDRIYLYSFAMDDEYVACYATAEPLERLSCFRLDRSQMAL
ncbi:4'-phosphopantetheinyl transferase family protein [Parapedobacter sp. 10938]|uniref:4'-phosphopantetheinyl transferase family protein n=1 Tax=Parapedobacter flavus TaxID=3110225 RepID=UPI002DBA33BD|nr:4'-phosphopantetheinyl transferase superfamily protein [Parapedobacter sp. 10938]MEC3879916.1 4'-phosphopantetheinyl transferase superfamily protein [Parapedobacter sp. 10938]